jgi:hypothetical protein
MSFDPEKITFFAKTDARGIQVPFGIKAKDRQRHMYVVGKTGMGKSTLLENMAAQDIANGEGMAFIDPHGSAAETLLDYVPEHRLDDVVYFAPFDTDNPISFNVMEDVGEDKRHLVVSGLMSTFKKIWVDAWSARMEYILTNALLALIEYPDTTLLSVNRLFSDKAYRKQVVEYIKDPAVKAYWTEEFANYTDRFTADALPAIQNKIGQFTGNPLIRNIIGQPHSSFDIREIMDDKKILIMNLSKGLIGETNANLLGSMLTTRIYLAAMSRANLPVEQMKTMPNFYFYVDEFQSFANSTFSNILSEARKYHLNLIIAHQYIDQMEDEVKSAVFGNVGTTISFRVGPFDAEVLETVFTPRFVASDIVNLGFAQIYLTLMIDGIGSAPFSAVTLPPVERPNVSCRDMVTAASRKNYTKGRDEVEKLVSELLTPIKVTPPPKKNNNPNNTNFKPKNNFNAPVVPVADRVVPQRTSAPQRELVVPQREPSKENNFVKTTEQTQSKRESVVTTTPDNDFTKRAPSAKLSPRSKDAPIRTESNRNQNSFTPRTVSEPVRKVQPAPKSQEDLRGILAKISAEQNESKTKDVQNKTAQSRVNNTNTKDRSTNNKKSPDLRSALADALKKVDTKSEKTKEVAVANTGLENTSATAKVGNNFTPASVYKKQEEENGGSKVNRDELTKLTKEVEGMFNTLDSAPKKTSLDDPLAPKKIQKMIKNNGTERSPFAS